MSGLKLIVLFFAIWILVAVIAQLRRSRHRRRPSNRMAEVRSVRCAHCGLHLPATDAHYAAGVPYCSKDHLALGPREPYR